MSSEFVSDFYLVLSRDRLEAYRPKDGSDLEMLTNYFWNIDLAEALVPCFHGVEVALRNSLHREFSKAYGTEMWFYEPGVLDSGGLEKLSEAVSKIAKKPPMTAGKLVAAFTFGFWVSLLSSRNEQKYWSPDSYSRLRAVFPHAEGVSRHNISKRFNEILDLRNRTFHFEGIWYRENLEADHSDIHEAIRWISPTLQQAILAVDIFGEVYRSKESVREKLQEHLGSHE